MVAISFDDFQKMEIRVGEIKIVEDLLGADKVYKLIVDIGGEERILVAGIKLFYQKEVLIGRKVLVLVNLEPKVIRGQESHGMILCAHNPDRSKVILTTVEQEIEVGARVS